MDLIDKPMFCFKSHFILIKFRLIFRTLIVLSTSSRTPRLPTLKVIFKIGYFINLMRGFPVKFVYNFSKIQNIFRLTKMFESGTFV